MASRETEMKQPQHGPIIISSSSTDVLWGTGKRCYMVISSSCCGECVKKKEVLDRGFCTARPSSLGFPFLYSPKRAHRAKGLLQACCKTQKVQ
jgi:hypothetical protein